MAQRTTRTEKWSYFEHVLANTEAAEKGNTACIDTSSGEIVAAQSGAGLLAIGYFEQNLVGNGTAKVRVRLFREITLDRFTNAAAPNAVAADDIGSFCYLAGPATVTMDATGNSVAGRVWGVSSTGVLVQMALDVGPTGPEGPEGPPA